MSAQHVLVGCRHGHDARLLHLFRHETLVHGETEHKGETTGQTGAEVEQIGRDTHVFQDLVVEGRFIAFLGRFYRELRSRLGAFAIRPVFLEADALFVQRFYTVS